MSNIGKVWIKGYDKSFCIIPGQGIEKETSLMESYGEVGYNLRYSPKADLTTLNIVLPSQKCDFTCTYCCANVHEKFISPSDLAFTEKVIQKLPIDSTVFGGKGEYIKIAEAYGFVKLFEKYGIYTTMTGNYYPELIDKLLSSTKLANSSISIEVPTGYNDIDRGMLYETVFNGTKELSEKYPGRLSFIPLIPLDGDPEFMVPYIKRLEESGIGCSWSVIYPVKRKRDNLYDVIPFTKMLANVLNQTDLRVCNFLSQSVIDVLVYGFSCLGVQNLYIIGDALVACPIRKIKVKEFTLESVYEAQKEACSLCKTDGNFLSCPFFAVPPDSSFSTFIWNYLAYAGEKAVKIICKNDEEIVKLFEEKKVSGGWHSTYLRNSKSGRMVNCNSNPILFTGN